MRSSTLALLGSGAEPTSRVNISPRSMAGPRKSQSAISRKPLRLGAHDRRDLGRLISRTWRPMELTPLSSPRLAKPRPTTGRGRWPRPSIRRLEEAKAACCRSHRGTSQKSSSKLDSIGTKGLPIRPNPAPAIGKDPSNGPPSFSQLHRSTGCGYQSGTNFAARDDRLLPRSRLLGFSPCLGGIR